MSFGPVLAGLIVRDAGDAEQKAALELLGRPAQFVFEARKLLLIVAFDGLQEESQL